MWTRTLPQAPPKQHERSRPRPFDLYETLACAWLWDMAWLNLASVVTWTGLVWFGFRTVFVLVFGEVSVVESRRTQAAQISAFSFFFSHLTRVGLRLEIALSDHSFIAS